MGKLPDSREKGRSLRRSARWTRLLAVILSPVAFLLISEVLLWVIGCGQPRRFFIRCESAGRIVHLANRRYCEHFVPPALSRDPAPSVLSAKGKATIRVFVLGGSAAYGDPDPAYGFCRQLEVLLNEHATGVSFEVVNAAVTSMNSHVARRIARDCAAHQPDVFIVFMGNNEVVGPYGPATLPAKLHASRRFIDLSILAGKDTRLGQLIKGGIQALRGRATAHKRWQGMEAFLANQFSRHDKRMQACYRHFYHNLNDIVDAAHACDAVTVLCTVPTNIRSSAPFASRHREGMTEVLIAAWDRLFAEGRALQLAGQYEVALGWYEQASQIDSAYADLSFSMGGCLLALGKAEEAKARFLEARDLDVLRFRADSLINGTVRQVARIAIDRSAILCDLEAHLERHAKDRIIGDDLLADHVHLNFRGNFLAAFAAMKALGDALPGAKLDVPETADGELFSLCRRRLLYDDREAWRLAMVMYRRKTRPPFVGQLDHDAELARLRGDLLSVYGYIREKSEPEGWYLAPLQRVPPDPYLNVRYGQYLLTAGRASDAIRLYRKVLAAQPCDRKIRVALATALAQGGMQGEALAVLTDKGVPNACSRREALLLLGTHYVKRGRISAAAPIYEELYRIDPDNPDILVNLAAAASHNGDLQGMKRHLDRALEVAPQSAQAMINMANYYAKMDRSNEACEWFGTAAEVDPHDHLAQMGLGIQLIRLGQLNKGMKHVEQAVLLKLDFAQGYEILAAAHDQLGNTDEARSYGQLRDLFGTDPNGDDTRPDAS